MILELILGIAITLLLLIALPYILVSTVVFGIFILTIFIAALTSYAIWVEPEFALRLMCIFIYLLFVLWVLVFGKSLFLKNHPNLKLILAGFPPYDTLNKMPLRILARLISFIITISLIISSLIGLTYIAEIIFS